ncbi:MAG: diguanylate cyclase, partial [Wenzhouxiangella sp.]
PGPRNHERWYCQHQQSPPCAGVFILTSPMRDWNPSSIRRARSARRTLMLDIDDFKLVNDRFGHAAGDQILKEFATRVGAIRCLQVERTPSAPEGNFC